MTAQQVDLNTRVAQYVKLRDKIKEMEDAHKAALAPYKDTLEKLGNLLQHALLASNQESARTSSGTVSLTTKKTASLADPQAFMDYVIANAAFDLLDRKANVKAVEDFMQDHNGSAPPGVNFTSRVEVGVRRPTGK